MCGSRGLPALVIYTLHHPLIYTTITTSRIYSLQVQGGFKQTYSEPNSLTRTYPLFNVWPTSGLPALVIYTLHHPLIYITIRVSELYSFDTDPDPYPDPGSRVFKAKNCKKEFSSHKEHPALLNMKFLNFSPLF